MDSPRSVSRETTAHRVPVDNFVDRRGRACGMWHGDPGYSGITQTGVTSVHVLIPLAVHGFGMLVSVVSRETRPVDNLLLAVEIGRSRAVDSGYVTFLALGQAGGDR
ncbi:hypothetical protein GCM10028775_54970 [Catellatospora paridis]